MNREKSDKRKEQGAETKKRLYEISERLFSGRDYIDVSVEDITSEAGITKGAFYVHFESKDALIALLIADYAARADADYQDFVENMPAELPAPAVLLALTEKIADVLVGTIGKKNMKTVYQMLLAGNAGAEAVKDYDRELYALFQSVLHRGILRGEINCALPIDILARHFIMAIRGITYEWCIRDSDFDLKEKAREYVCLLMGGLCVTAQVKEDSPQDEMNTIDINI